MTDEGNWEIVGIQTSVADPNLHSFRHLDPDPACQNNGCLWMSVILSNKEQYTVGLMVGSYGTQSLVGPVTPLKTLVQTNLA